MSCVAFLLGKLKPCRLALGGVKAGSWLSIGVLSVGLMATETITQPQVAVAEQAAPSDLPSIQRLLEMFSPEIRQTINACDQQGQVDLVAGPTASGTVLCGDGTPTDVSFEQYINTVSDLLVASSLVGFRTVTATNPGLSPEMLSVFLAQAEGSSLLRSGIESAIASSNLFPVASAESAEILTDEVMERLMPSLQDSSTLPSLLGTPDQYNQVVTSFCTAPGMSVSQIQSLVELTPVQLYAICVQESGVTDDLLQLQGAR